MTRAHHLRIRIAETDVRIVQQRSLLLELGAAGHPTAQARELLELLIEARTSYCELLVALDLGLFHFR